MENLPWPSDSLEIIDGLPVHPAASIFPMSDDETIQALAEDIKKNGLQEAIIVASYGDPTWHQKVIDHGGEFWPDRGSVKDWGDTPKEIREGGRIKVLIDGRNRLKACKIAGVSPYGRSSQPFNPLRYDPGDPGWEEYVRNWIYSRNFHRRHLTTSQKAMVGTDFLALAELDAKERMREGAKRGNDTKHGKTSGKAILPQASDQPEDKPVKLTKESRQARDEVAEKVGVSPRLVSDAKKIKSQSPELAAKVRDGEITVTEAKKTLNPKPKVEKTPDQLLEEMEKKMQTKAARFRRDHSREEIDVFIHYLNIEKES